MARTIWMLRSTMASASREKPVSTPSAKPALPPMARPIAARLRLSHRCRGSSPVSVRCQAVVPTELGAGSTVEAMTPVRASSSQQISSRTGTAQEIVRYGMRAGFVGGLGSVVVPTAGRSDRGSGHGGNSDRCISAMSTILSRFTRIWDCR